MPSISFHHLEYVNDTEYLDGLTYSTGNGIEALSTHTDAYGRMLTAIRRARHSILLAHYCMVPGDTFDRFYELLLAKAEQGVTVKILADHHGSDASEAQVSALQLAGAEFVWFRPLRISRFWDYNRRLHKKLLLIDGTVGFTGGFGIADFWSKPTPGYPAAWRDTHFRVTGPAVAEMTAAFRQSWQQFSVLPLRIPPAAKTVATTANTLKLASVNSPAGGGLSDAGKLHAAMIDSADKSIDIVTAYFGPNRLIRQRLMEAARRHVRVRLMVNGPYATHRIAQMSGCRPYPHLLDAGVEIYEYQPTKIHAKQMLVDGRYAVIGSANMNFRSYFHDQEFNMVADDRRLAGELKSQFQEDLAESVRVTRQTWDARPWYYRAACSGASLARYFF